MQSTIEKNKKYLLSVNNMRALASVAVMLFHFIGNEHFLDHVTVLKKIAAFGHYGVEMFFVISGFIIPYSLYQTHYRLSYYGKFILKRIIRLDPPYLASILCILLLNYGLSKFSHAVFDISWKQLLLHLGYLNAFFQEKWLSVIFWTLSVEFQYYILLGLFFPLLIGEVWVRRLSVLMLLILAFVFRSVPRDFFIVHTPVFVVGIVSFLWYTQQINRREFIIWLGLSAVCIVLMDSWVTFAVALFSIGLLFSFSYQHKWLTFLGNISYSLYLMHTIIGGILISVFKKRTEGAAADFLTLLLAVATTLLASYVLYWIVEKPSQKYSSRIHYDTKPPV